MSYFFEMYFSLITFKTLSFFLNLSLGLLRFMKFGKQKKNSLNFLYFCLCWNIFVIIIILPKSDVEIMYRKLRSRV